MLARDEDILKAAEDWRRDTTQSGKLSVTAEFIPDPANPGDHVVVTLAWYRGSRFGDAGDRWPEDGQSAL